MILTLDQIPDIHEPNGNRVKFSSRSWKRMKKKDKGKANYKSKLRRIPEEKELSSKLLKTTKETF